MLIFFALGSPAFAQQNVRTATASGPLSSADLSGHIDYFLDPDWKRDVNDMIGSEAGNFAPIETSEPSFGYIDDKVWLRISVKNATPDIEQWRLYVRENFLQYFDIYVLRETGEINHIESHDLDSPFSDRVIAYPEMVTPFKMSPQESVTIYISYWSGGSSHTAISIETGDSFAALATTRTSKHYISYGMMMILIVASMLALLLLRMRVFSAYLAYVFVTLLYLMHGDGVAFQFLWPNLPRLNANFSIIIGTAFVMATYNFAIVFLQTKKYHPVMHRILLGMFWLTPLITIPGAFIDPQWTKRAIIAMVLIGIIAGTLAGIKVSMTRFREVRFFLFAWVFGILTAGLMNMRHVFGFDIAQDTVFDSIRISIVIDAIMMGLGVAERYTQILQSRQFAIEQSLGDAKRNLQLNTRLQKLEEQYTLAAELAASKDQNLKNTVHDLQQPLHALRLRLKSLASGELVGEEEGHNIDESFSYLETLISNQLQNSVKASAEISGGISNEAERRENTQDTLDMPKVLASIYEMFLHDAKEKGLAFNFVQTSQDAHLEPLVLMRIVTNIVSNAIKYTSSGKILLGVRRTNNSVRIEVHDTGLGLTQDEFEKAKVRHVRLHEDQTQIAGQGFGLSIASDLAAAHGLELYVLPGREKGTSVILEVPTKKRSKNLKIR